MKNQEIIATAKRLKPTLETISHFTAVSGSTKMRSTFSVYTDGNNFFLSSGRIFNRKQNHTVELTTVNYSDIIKFLEIKTK